MTERVDRALAAGVAVARAHGVAARDPVLLGDGSNVRPRQRPAAPWASCTPSSPVCRRCGTALPLHTPLDDLAVFAERGTRLRADPALVERTAGLSAPVRGSPRACEW
jgi:hypothetical protein